MKPKYGVAVTNQFKKDLKVAKKRKLDIDLLEAIVAKLANGEVLDPKFKDHALTGNYRGYRECHINPDWLLVYKVQNDILILTLQRTGSHSDLF
ncbi:MAG: type II toxin-antitoxin system YafQ family toxin [Anaerocolumna sp.]